VAQLLWQWSHPQGTAPAGDSAAQEPEPADPAPGPEDSEAP